MKFAALGRTHLLYDAAAAAQQRGHELVFVATQPAAPEYQRTEEDFRELAAAAGCPFFLGASLNAPEPRALIAESHAEVAISVNWTTLLAAEALSLFKFGVVNAHFGDLPRYRGNAIPNWAIVAGESEIVVTLHTMVPELDAGPILKQQRMPLTDNTYVGEVYDFASRVVPGMFADVLDAMAAGKLEPREQAQDPALSLRCLPRRPTDSLLDFTQDADSLARLVRASSEPFAGAYTYLDGKRVIIWRAHAEDLRHPTMGIAGQVVSIDPKNGHVAVLTGNGLLLLEVVQVEAGPRRAAAEVVRSTRTRLGLDFHQEIAALKERIARLEAQ